MALQRNLVPQFQRGSPARSALDAGDGSAVSTALAAHLIAWTLGRLPETGGDRLAGEAKDRQVFDQAAGLPWEDRAKYARVQIVHARLGQRDGLADRAAVDAVSTVTA